MAFSKMPVMGKMVTKGKAKTSKPMPKSIYMERMKKPEPDNYPARPPKSAAARAKRLKGVAL